MVRPLQAGGVRLADSAIRWETPVCPTCGSDENEPVLEAQDHNPTGGGLWFAVAQCRQCRLLFTSPRPDATSIGEFYPAGHYPRKRERFAQSPRTQFLRREREIDRPLVPLHGMCRLLDVNCGPGEYLIRLHRRGWRVTGIDPSRHAIAEIHEGLGLQAVCGSLPHPELHPRSFDVITMWYVLERMHEPLAALTAARELLAPKGKLIVTSANAAGPAFRLFGADWSGLDLPRRLIHFTPETATAMMQRAGFANVDIQPIVNVADLRASARRASARPHASVTHRMLAHRTPAEFAARFWNAKGQADAMIATARE